jgi:hypothetical protein
MRADAARSRSRHTSHEGDCDAQETHTRTAGHAAPLAARGTAHLGAHAGQRRTQLRPRRARRTAFASLKHRFEKVGDHWEAKDHAGPSDPRAAHGSGESFGGVDLYGHTRQELYERARELGVRGRSAMTKVELARAIATRQR